ncbi:MAG: ABC transporter permease [Clostridiales bacterium]|jgi:spermidine/putrescine transport system permease protein|nr:ABC transporter permease [Clostridiales bacterium]
MKNRKLTIIGWSLIAVMLIATYFPIAIIVIFSFSENKVVGDWKNFSFSAALYHTVFTSDKIMPALLNTFIVALSAAAAATVIGTFAAIGIYYCRRRMKSVLTTLNQITLVNADIVTGVSLMFFFLLLLGRLNGIPAMIIGHTVITLPYVILMVMPRLSQLNPNLYEAGLDLGAGPARTLFTVILPQLVPAMLGGFIMAFTLSMDDYVIAKFIKGGSETVSTLIYNSAKVGLKPEFRALSTLLFALVLAVLAVINIKSARRSKKSGGGLLPFIR